MAISGEFLNVGCSIIPFQFIYITAHLYWEYSLKMTAILYILDRGLGNGFLE